MAEQETLLTANGLKKLEEELEHLKTVRRKEVAQRLKQAIEYGDISENSEYEDAKNEQAFIEGRILTLEKKLRNAKVISGNDAPNDVVSLGNRVTLKDLDEQEEFQYEIVGSLEADPAENRISNESPIGKALIGHRVGEIVTIQVPAGSLRFQILNIEKVD
ncbi:MAG: transcription elongation factor GreA [Clostridia bacterium]|nr:transcription elongation factor GreA [Clostridia bacterium]